MKRLILLASVMSFIFVGSASSADTLQLRLIQETNSTITLGWTPQSGYGYLFSADDKVVSRTYDANRSTVKFSTNYSKYEVAVIAKGATGTWPPPAEPPPPPPGSANLYVDSNGGTCTRSATLTYVDAAACSSFAAAYSAAQSGDVIGVTGNLGVQKFAGGYQSTQPSGTKTLTFKGIPGNKVKQIHFGSINLTFDGLDVDGGGTQTTGAVFENGGRAFTFKNGRIGNVADEKAALVTGAGIIFDNVVFHDAVIKTNGVHMECIWAGVPEGMIVRNSRFENCAVMDIFFTYPDYWVPLPPPYGNVTLENNYFDYPRSFNGSTNGYSIYVGKNGVSLSNQTPMSGWRVRNNFFREDPNSNQDYGVNVDQPLGSNNIFCGNSGHQNIPSNWKVAC